MKRICLICITIFLTVCTTTLAGDVQNDSGSMFRDCRNCPDMVWLSGGTFIKGSPQDEEGRSEDSRNHDEDDMVGPGGSQVSVTVPPFALGAYEVTNKQFSAFVADSGYEMPGGCIADLLGDGSWGSHPEAAWNNTGQLFEDDFPASCIDWNAATAYTRWLSLKTGANYRLATESEFEYALRAGSTTRYHFGDDIEDWCQYGNVPDASFNTLYPEKFTTQCDDGYVSLAPVGQFEPNGFGLYDMTGNVWEWLQDCYEYSYANVPTDGSALVKEDCIARSLRGGSWGYDLPSLRSADRSDDPPAALYDGLGFRVARDLDEDVVLAPDWNLRVYDNREYGFSILYSTMYQVLEPEGDILFSTARDKLMPKMDVSLSSEHTSASVEELVEVFRDRLEGEGKKIASTLATPVTLDNGKTEAVEIVLEWMNPGSDRLFRTLNLSASNGVHRISVHLSDRADADWSDLRKLAYTLSTKN